MCTHYSEGQISYCGPSRGPGEEAVATWDFRRCSLPCEGSIKGKRKETMKGKIGVHSRVSTTEARASRFPYSLTPRPPVFSGLSTSSRLPSWMGSPSRIPAAPLIFALSSLQVLGPLPLASYLHLWGQRGCPSPARVRASERAGEAAPVVGLPGKSGTLGRGVWLENRVGKFPSVS